MFVDTSIAYKKNIRYTFLLRVISQMLGIGCFLKHFVYSPEKIIVTRKFYNYIQDILATGYVEEFIRNE